MMEKLGLKHLSVSNAEVEERISSMQLRIKNIIEKGEGTADSIRDLTYAIEKLRSISVVVSANKD